MAVELTESDLLADISQDELDGLTKNLISLGQPDPVETAIAEAYSTIGMYVDPFQLQDDALRKLWRLIALVWCYNRLGSLPKKRQDERDWCMSVLKDIRDGKFKNLLVQDPLPENIGGKGSWGSGTQLKF